MFKRLFDVTKREIARTGISFLLTLFANLISEWNRERSKTDFDQDQQTFL